MIENSHIHTSYVVFSVAPDRCRAFELWAALERIHTKTVYGVWKGQAEICSYVAKESDMQTIKDATWLREQEAVIVLGPVIDGEANKRHAMVIRVSDEKEIERGIWQEVEPSEAAAAQGMTFDPTSKKYYAIA